MKKKRLHDVYIAGQGYMLADPEQGITGRVITPLAQKVVTGEPTYSDYDVYSVLAQSKFTGGAGIHDLEDPEAYKWAWNMDTRGDRVTKGPKVQSTRPSGLDASGTLGEMSINGRNLNLGLALELTDNERWLSIDGERTGIAVPFVSGQEQDFDPQEIDGLKTWLDASVGTWQDNGVTPAAVAGELVKQWDNQVAGATPFTVSSTTNRPTLRHDGSNWTIQSSGLTSRLTSQVTITGGVARTLFLVMKVPTGGDWNSDDYALDFGGSGEKKRWAVTGDTGTERVTFRADGGNAKFGSIDRDTLFMVTLVQSAEYTDNIEAWIDGDPSPRHSLNSIEIDTPSGNTARLFTDATASNFTNVHIAEVLYYEGALSDSNRVAVESYLTTKYGIQAPVPASYGIQHASIYLRSLSGFDATQYRFYIRSSDVDGKPTTSLGQTGVVPRASVSYDGYWLHMAFESEVVPPSGKYWLTFEIDGSAVDGENVEVFMVSHANIPQEYMYLDSGGAWQLGNIGDIGPYSPMMTADYHNQSPTLPIQKFVEFRGKADRAWVYGLAGRKLYRIISPDHIEPLSPTLTQDGTWLAIVRNPGDAETSLVICQGMGAPMLVWDGDLNSVVFNEIRLANTNMVDAEKLVAFDSLYFRSGISDTEGVFVQGADRYDDWDTNVSNKAPCGTSRFPVRQMFTWKSQLYALKADGLFVAAIPEDWNISEQKYQWSNLVDLSSVVHPANGQAACIWQEDLYFTLAHGLARFTASNLFEDVNPDSMLRDQGRERGVFSALLPTLTQMYAGYSSRVGNWSSVLSYNGAWHPLTTLDRQADPIEALISDSGLYGNIGRIWYSSHGVINSFVDTVESLNRYKYATGVSTSRIKFHHRPSSSILNKRYSELFTSWFSGTLINIYKDWINLSVMCEFVDENSFIEVYYRTEQEGEFTYLGKVTEFPVQDLVFPFQTASLKIQFKFRFISANDYTTPIWIGYALRYLNRPQVAERIVISVLLAKDTLLHNGSVETRSVEEQYRHLLAAREAPESVLLIEPSGMERRVSIDELSRRRSGEFWLNDRLYDEVMVVSLGAIETG